MLNITLSILCLLFTLYSASNLYNIHKEVQKKPQQENIPRAEAIYETQLFPVRLRIPRIDVDARVEYVGVTPSGDMDVPTNTIDVGWFKLGTLPGQKGSAVIAGHVDGENGKKAVFTELHKLKAGDKLYVEDEKGIATSFVVREKRTYDPGFVAEVFVPNDTAHLNLVTCGGTWDEAKKAYSKRLVVFADIIK